MSKFWNRIRLALVPQKDKEFVSFIYSITGFIPTNIDLYRLSFIHKSSYHSVELGCNERLEFLGDAILDSVVADYMYEHFPERKEGDLSEMRSCIVRRENMNALGLEMGLCRHLKASIPNLKKNDAIGNCLEALIGAIYKDLGYKKTRQFIENKLIKTHVTDEKILNKVTNYKSQYIQMCQKYKMNFRFETSDEENTKRPSFICNLYRNEVVIATSKGKSKKIAEQNAAKIGLHAKWK